MAAVTRLSVAGIFFVLWQSRLTHTVKTTSLTPACSSQRERPFCDCTYRVTLLVIPTVPCVDLLEGSPHPGRWASWLGWHLVDVRAVLAVRDIRSEEPVLRGARAALLLLLGCYIAADSLSG